MQNMISPPGQAVRTGSILIKFLMKRILLIFALIAATFSQNAYAQSAVIQGTPVLSLYYALKDALVADNAGLAAAKAVELKRALSSAEPIMLSEPGRSSLLKDANQISASKDIKAQRTAFASMSATLLAIAKTEKLSTQPLYQLYCPMKKSSWLSNEKAVKNPYYGRSMLTCGKVEATL